MNFIQEQISDLLFDLASEKGGTHILLNLTLGCIYESRAIFPSKENSGEYAFFVGKGRFSFQCGALSSRCLFFCLQSIIFKRFWLIATIKTYKPAVFGLRSLHKLFI